MAVAGPREFPVLDVREVHDGDSYRLLLDQGFESAGWPWLRLRNYSCPELPSEAGLAAKAAAEELLQNALSSSGLWVVTYKVAGWGDTIKAAYGRYAADVWIGDWAGRAARPGESLGELLLKAGHARRGKFKG